MSDDKLRKISSFACGSGMQTAVKLKSLTYKLEGDVEVDFDTFCDLIEAEEWELPKRVLDVDCIKKEPEASPEPENSEAHIEYQEVESACDGNHSPSDKERKSRSSRYPKRQSKRKIYVEPEENSETDIDSEWIEELSTNSEADETKQSKRSQTTKRQHECPECPKSFRRHQTLLAHKRTHTEERPFKCPHCPKVFAQSHHAKDHLNTHSGHRPHKCPHCSKAFVQKSNLKAHIYTHYDEKTRPYKCTQCSKRFVRNYDLTAHQQIHTDDLPNKCPYKCPKAFIRRRDLERHIRIHTGELPFKCPKCSLEFSRNDVMKLHMRNHTIDNEHKRRA